MKNVMKFITKVHNKISDRVFERTKDECDRNELYALGDYCGWETGAFIGCISSPYCVFGLLNWKIASSLQDFGVGDFPNSDKNQKIVLGAHTIPKRSCPENFMVIDCVGPALGRAEFLCSSSFRSLYI